jgi:hypothetical protein
MAKQLKGEPSMVTKNKRKDRPPELEAVGIIYSALKTLDTPIQIRSLRYVAEMLDLDLGSLVRRDQTFDSSEARIEEPETVVAVPIQTPERSDGEIEGVSAVAIKWMKRSGLDPKGLQTLFSLGIEEIDLVSQSVPGGNKKERMRSVVLLKGIAAYLGTGAARISYEQLKEACLHYKAYDAANFAAYLRSFAAEVGGTKEAGYTLTARGLAAGTDLVKQILTATSKKT